MPSSTHAQHASKEPAARVAALLEKARRGGPLLDGLDEADRPRDCAAALAVQDRAGPRVIGGWKCALPQEERVILAPIARDWIVESPARLQGYTSGLRYEAELAFVLARDLPDGWVGADAVAQVRLALELVHGRFRDPETVDFHTMLADNLFNEGLVLGPAIDPATIHTIDTIEATGAAEDHHDLAFHPAGDPVAPLIWLADHLAAKGTPLRAGMAVITGAFAPARPVPNAGALCVTFGHAGQLTVNV